MHIAVDDLTGPAILEFLGGHLADMRTQGPPESTHALDADALRDPAVTVWAVRDDTGELIGCGALKELAPDDAEIKSMRTAPWATGRGIAGTLLQHMIGEARGRGYRTLHLETGSTAYFAPARRLYLRHGFVACPPFADYPDDPNSVHLRLDLPG
ncbi:MULTISPECIES: GNAT family N-acetyltransferase [Pseudonocardia]|uniref:Putative N-acetyltransferase YsnE n=1 Tax=Pseudonocardia autotrophica TaxID=2074 RepID=A0A1Y2MGQ5_PSEAH|nr:MULTISPECIES: GNAT family N-acetyltransferase [Pseudonocardia]OSY34473.1 putative N-acetyltransferase YsnE [Pseudonocardia autotrophica]TDN71538.1 putative acetyltransferase [Pseudonocardia autotrophica]